MLSALCGHYHWQPDFWRRMGRREFYAWVDQRAREENAQRAQPDRWGGEDDAWWQAARERRERLRGR